MPESERMPRSIDAVLFDFDHTLGVDHRLEESVMRDLSGRYCGSPFSDEGIAASLARFRTGSVGLAGMLEEAFAHCAPAPDLMSLYKREALALVEGRVTAFPGCREMLDAFRARGLSIAILSNGWTELQHAKAAAVGFDGPVYVSEEIGAWKPDRLAFATAAERLGVSLRRCMYVGDNPVTDVAGSKSVGMTAVWADLEGRPYPGDVEPPDFTVSSLRDLLELPLLVAG